MTISKQTRKLLNERLQMIDSLRHKFGREFSNANNPDSICTKCGFLQDHKLHDELWKVQCWESEQGWGTSAMGVRYFNTKAKADAYVLDYNKDNTKKTVPSVYFYADTPVRCITFKSLIPKRI